jgi:uncharacterized coiled-coil protein SlyX
MTDQRLSNTGQAEHSEARATIVAHAREAFAHDLERQRKQAELIEELSRASADMQTQVERRELLMNAMVDAQSTDPSPAPASHDTAAPDGVDHTPPARGTP